MRQPFRALLTSSAATLLGTAVSAAFSVVYVSLGARWLGPEEYAGVAIAMSTTSLLQVAFNPVEVGLTMQVAGQVGRGELGRVAGFGRRCMVSMVLLAAPLGILWALIEYVGRGRPTGVWMAAFAALTLVSCVPRAVLRGRESFVMLAANWIIEALLRLAAGLLLVALGFGAAGMVAGYALGVLAATVHGELGARRGLPGAPPDDRPMRLDLWLPFRGLSAPLLGLHVYTAVCVNADMLAAGHYLSAAQAGLYGGSAALARIVLVAAQPVLLVIFSRLASLSAAQSDTRGTARLGAAVVGGGLVVSMAIPLLFGDLLMRLFLGAAFEAGSAVLAWQWATACVLVAQVFAVESMLATSRVRGGLLFVAPSVVLVAGLGLFHDDALEVARTTFVAAAVAGSATCAVFWRARSAG